MKFGISFWLVLIVIIIAVYLSFVPQDKQGLPGSNSLQTARPVAVIPLRQMPKSEKINAQVVYVIDGDTVMLSDNTSVRLIGINAPEKNQPYYNESRQKLTELVAGKKVVLVFDLAKKDAYARLLAYIYVDTLFVNIEMVKSGFAVPEVIAPNVLYAESFAKAASSAQGSCSGIWEGLCSSKSGCIRISEVHYNAKGDDTKNINDEYVKLTNTCSYTQSLKGYMLKDSSAGNSYTFSQVTLASNGNILLHSGCGVSSQQDLYWQCPQKTAAVWNNSGDHAYLYNSTGKLVSDMRY